MLKTSNSVKALVRIAYGGRVGWAIVSTGGGMNDKITYRTLDIGIEIMKRFRSMEKKWLPVALNWGRYYESTGLLITTLNRNTVVKFVTSYSMGKRESAISLYLLRPL